MIKRLLTTGMLLAACSTGARADVLFYGGDTNYFFQNFAWDAYSEQNSITGGDYRFFDNVSVPAGETWTVTGMFAHVGDPASSSSLNANWFIATGVTAASMGTPVASGTNAPGTLSDVGVGALLNGNITSEKLTINLGAPVVLSGGQTYWFALQPISLTDFHIFTGGTTDHVNAVGGPLDSATVAFAAGVGQNISFDASAGLLGTKDVTVTPAPEPMTAALLATGVAGVLTARRRRRAVTA